MRPMKSDRHIACIVTGQAALDASALPTRLTLLRWGRNDTAQGVFIVNGRTVEGIRRQVSGGIFDRVMLDFQHNSERGHPNYQPPPRHHAAVGRPECVEGEGIAMGALEWTPKGKEFALDYPDLSACVAFDKATREVTGLRSAALCTQGAAVNGIAFFDAGDEPENPHEVQTMPEENPAVAALSSEVKSFGARLDAIEKLLTPAKADAAAALSATETLKTQFAALSAEGTKLRKAAMLDLAKREGKIVALSESAIAALSEDDLKDHLGKLQKGKVPLGRQTTTETEAAALDADALMGQYNAITDPTEKAAFFKAHRAEMGL